MRYKSPVLSDRSKSKNLSLSKRKQWCVQRQDSNRSLGVKPLTLDAADPIKLTEEEIIQENYFKRVNPLCNSETKSLGSASILEGLSFKNSG